METNWKAEYSLMINRYRFLLAVQKCVPNAIRSLHREVFPLFRALFRTAPSRISGERAIMVPNESGEMLWINWRCQILISPSWASEFECENLEPERAAFKEAVERWANIRHLNTTWVKEEVFST